MSDLQGRRIPGEEGSGRRRPWVWIILGLILLLLLALLVPFACQSLTGGSDQGGDGSGAQGGAEQSAPADGNGEGAGEDAGGNANGAQGDGGADEGGDAGGDAAGGGGNGGDGAGEQADSGDQQEVAAAGLSVRDQGGDGASVTVPTATVEGTRGWLAVRANDGGEPGEVLGHAPLRDGTNNDVEVELDRPVDSSQRLYVTVHAERPADGEFTYPDGDPTLERDGRTLAEPISYTVGEDATDGASDDTASDGTRDDELPDSGGLSPTVLLAAGALLLAASAWGLRRASR